MKHFLIFILIPVSLELFSQSINIELKEKLDSIMILDQSTRELLDPRITDQRKTELLKELGCEEDEFYSNPWGKIDKQDSINQQEIFKIISTYGYPGKSLVGEPTNETAWYVIQHSDYIEKYLPLIKQAGETGELPMRLVAMMEDRYLGNIGKEQIYGTQSYGSEVTDSITGEKQWIHIIWPIENPETVNERRKSIGFDTTIEEYAAGLDIEYKIFTLDQAKEMLGK